VARVEELAVIEAEEAIGDGAGSPVTGE